MLIHDPPKPQARKDLKVALPARQLRALRRMRTQTGLETTTLVSRALALYFSRLPREARPRQ